MSISVLMSLYDKEDAEYLKECLRSLEVQTYLADEVVIVEDGPIGPDLRSVLDEFRQALPIKTVVLERNQGLGVALNAGLAECTYELVARMDTDDVAYEKRFEVQYEFMSANPNVDICGGCAVDIDENGKELGLRTVPEKHEEIVRLIWSCPVIHPSVMFRKSSIVGINSYDPVVAHRQEDYELWIRAAENNLIFHNLQNAVIAYRTPNGYLKKNSISVGFNRFKLGIRAARRFDPRLYSYAAVCYPLVRALLPMFIRKAVTPKIRRLDPR